MSCDKSLVRLICWANIFNIRHWQLMQRTVIMIDGFPLQLHKNR